jgi:hypothetical protein
MTDTELFQMRAAMNEFGGSFVRGLSVALSRADAENTQRILAAFPELVEKYGPGSDAINSIEEDAA